MDRNDTKHDSNVNEDINQSAAVNAIPLTAILLALVASCNSGTTRSKYYSISGWVFQKYAFSNFFLLIKFESSAQAGLKLEEEKCQYYELKVTYIFFSENFTILMRIL